MHIRVQYVGQEGETMAWKYKQQIRLGYDSNGKPVRKWIYSNSKEDLIYQKRMLQKAAKEGPISTDTTFKEYADQWVDVYKSHTALATQSSTKHDIAECESIHYIPVSKITSMDCQAIINKHQNEPDAAKKLSLTLNGIFRQLVTDGIIQRNPAAGLRLPKKVKGKQRVMSDAEKGAVRKLLRRSDTRLSQHDKTFLCVLYYLGLRPEEARGLMKQDFNWTRKEVTIERALAFDGNVGYIKDTKSYNIRTLPVPDAAVPWLKSYCAGLSGMYLFTKDDGLPHTSTTYKHLWKRIRKEINLSVGGTSDIDAVAGFVPYCFRRNYATTLFYSGISLKKAAYLLGHSTTKMIIEIYAQIDDQRENLDALRRAK